MNSAFQKRASCLKRFLIGGVGVVLIVVSAVAITGSHYKIDYLLAMKQGIRKIAVPLFAILYAEDEDFVRTTCGSYLVGIKVSAENSLFAEWRDIEKRIKGFYILSGTGLVPLDETVPFIYQQPDAPPMKSLAERYGLQAIVAPGKNEFEKFKLLCAWVGTRWDHGDDPVPGGNLVYWPAEVIAAGEDGAAFWCEIAARLTVQSATSLGWPARLVSASRNGYDWQHALAEIWSNQFRKWVLFDTDYNIFYQANGVPLSAFELCHKGAELQKSGKLQVIRFAPLKPSLNEVNLWDLYQYVHIDMRNDWYVRRLRQGSPASGDLATWWTAQPAICPILTAKIRVNEPQRFDWPVNSVAIQPNGIFIDKKQVNIALRGYSPYFKMFEWRIDERDWKNDEDGVFSMPLLAGRHCLEARIRTQNMFSGPVYNICYKYEIIQE